MRFDYQGQFRVLVWIDPKLVARHAARYGPGTVFTHDDGGADEGVGQHWSGGDGDQVGTVSLLPIDGVHKRRQLICVEHLQGKILELFT